MSHVSTSTQYTLYWNSVCHLLFTRAHGYMHSENKRTHTYARTHKRIGGWWVFHWKFSRWVTYRKLLSMPSASKGERKFSKISTITVGGMMRHIAVKYANSCIFSFYLQFALVYVWYYKTIFSNVAMCDKGVSHTRQNVNVRAIGVGLFGFLIPLAITCIGRAT